MKTLFPLVESPFRLNFSAPYQTLGIAEESFGAAHQMHKALQKLAAPFPIHAVLKYPGAAQEMQAVLSAS